MNVRTGDQHEFAQSAATKHRYKVAPMPSIDYAQKALLDAQNAYFNVNPEARKIAKALIWHIEQDPEVPYPITPALRVDGEQVTVPVSKEVQDALAAWSVRYTAEIADVLEAYGISPYDIAVPQWRRIVPAEPTA